MSYTEQPIWHIDPSAPNNDGTGLTIDSPIRDCEERWRRCGTDYVIKQPTTIIYHGNPPDSDVELFSNVKIGYGGSLSLQGIRTAIATGTLTNFSSFDRIAQTKNIIEDTNLIGGFASYVGRYIRITSGTRTGTDWIITKDLGGGRAEISTPGITSLSSASGLFTRVTPVIGDNYEIVSIPVIRCGTFAFSAGSHQIASSSVARVVISDLECDFGNKNSGATTAFASGIVSEFIRVLAVRCRLDAVSVRANGLILYQCYHYGYIQVRGGSSIVLKAGAHTSHLSVLTGAYAKVDFDELFQGAQITATRGGFVEIGTACVFDKNGDGVAINPGSTVLCTPDLDGVTALWGTGNTVGLEIQAGGQLFWWNGTGGAKPSVNAGLGLGKEVRIGGTDMLYSAIPAVNNNAVIGTWP